MGKIDVVPDNIFKIMAVRARSVASLFGKAEIIKVIRSFTDLPAAIQKSARQQGGDEYSTKGVFDQKTILIYVIVDTHTDLRDVRCLLK